MLELTNITHRYPGAETPALQGIDLQLQAGQCLGLLGSNGAGKTTLLSLLAGVLPLQQGEIRWDGERSLGLVPQQLAFYAELKVRENLELFADLYRLRGAERAIESRTDELNLVMSVSATHNLANLRMTQEQSFAALSQVVALAQGAKVAVNVSLSCVFGCPMEGDVPEADVFGWVQRFVDVGVRGITLCDTTGMAYPTQVHRLTAAARARWAGVEFTLHFHNTRGMGLANVLAAIDAGADRFDASLGGLGGCPYAPE